MNTLPTSDKRRKWSDEQIQKMIEMRKSGAKISQICRETGAPRETVTYWTTSGFREYRSRYYTEWIREKRKDPKWQEKLSAYSRKYHADKKIA
jgi:transposase-like protein